VVNVLLTRIPEEDALALIYQINNHEETAWHIARERRHYAVIETLCDLGADVSFLMNLSLQLKKSRRQIIRL